MDRTADGHEIKLFEWYWDNDLSLVKLVGLADWPANEIEPAWHKTQVIKRWDGTMPGNRFNHSDSSRLARFHPMDFADAWALRLDDERAWEEQQHRLNV